MDVVLASISVFIIIFIVPIIVYGLFSRFLSLNEPEKKARFFIGVIIQKVATTAGFVVLYSLGKDSFSDRWLVYGLSWAAMYALTEIGQMYLSDYSKKEALAGIISEIIYFPAAAYLLFVLL